MDDTEKVLDNWRVQLRAMDEADATTLRSCFTDDAVLVHMTGYRQPVDEWMAGIEAKEFVYHQVIEHDVDVTVDGNEAKLHAHITTGYRPDGSGQAWPLDVRQRLVRDGDQWLCAESIVRFG